MSNCVRTVCIQDGEIEESGRVTFGDELLDTNGLYDSFIMKSYLDASHFKNLSVLQAHR